MKKHAPALPPLYGLILNGGNSSRMGTDKSKLTYHTDNQLYHMQNLLLKLCPKVFVSVKTSQKLTSDYNVILDKYDLNSPLNAILSAFGNFPDVNWLIVACDMPFITEQTLQKLILNQQTDKLAIAYLNHEDHLPEPLITIWNATSYLLLLDFYKKGYKSPRRFLIQHLEAIATIEPLDEWELFNANTPEQKKLAEEIILKERVKDN